MCGARQISGTEASISGGGTKRFRPADDEAFSNRQPSKAQPRKVNITLADGRYTPRRDRFRFIVRLPMPRPSLHIRHCVMPIKATVVALYSIRIFPCCDGSGDDRRTFKYTCGKVFNGKLAICRSRQALSVDRPCQTLNSAGFRWRYRDHCG